MTATTPGPIRTTVVAALGGVLEYFDFVLFALLAQPLGDAFFPKEASSDTRVIEAFGVFAAGYLARPFGGLFFSHRADRQGRKGVFAQTVSLMALTAGLIAILPGYATLGVVAPALLILLRVVQGLAFGGELPGAMCFLAEQVPAAHRCLALGILIAAVNAGNLVAYGVIAAVGAFMTPEAFHDWGWRIPFAVGALAGLFSILVRKHMSETSVFMKMQAERRIEKVPARTLMRDHWRTVLHMLALVSVHAGVVSLFFLALPTLLPKFTGLSPTEARGVATWVTIIGTPCYVLGGFVADRLGRRVAILGTLVLTAIAAPTSFILIGQGHVLPGAILGVVPPCLFVGSYLASMVDAFPANVRTSGIGLAYNIGYAVVGGGIPTLSALMLHEGASPWMVSGVLGALAVIAFLVESLWPRTAVRTQEEGHSTA